MNESQPTWVKPGGSGTGGRVPPRSSVLERVRIELLSHCAGVKSEQAPQPTTGGRSLAPPDGKNLSGVVRGVNGTLGYEVTRNRRHGIAALILCLVVAQGVAIRNVNPCWKVRFWVAFPVMATCELQKLAAGPALHPELKPIDKGAPSQTPEYGVGVNVRTGIRHTTSSVVDVRRSLMSIPGRSVGGLPTKPSDHLER